MKGLETVERRNRTKKIAGLENALEVKKKTRQ